MVSLRAIVVCLAIHLAAPAREVVTSLAELRALPTEEAAGGVPVRVEGVVLGLEPTELRNFFAHDGTAGCAIHVAREGRPANLAPGDRVLLEGRSETYGFYPTMTDVHVTLLGKGEFPPPLKPGPTQLFAPELDSQWVEVPAMVTAYENDRRCFVLTLEVYGLPFKAELPLAADNEKKAAALMQRPARMRGVMATVFNRQRQMTDRSFHISSCDSIVPTVPQANGETSPLVSVTQLLTGSFGPTTLVRLQGTVTQIDPKGFYLRDASGSTMIHAANSGKFPPGTRVEAEGFGVVSPFRPVLRAIRVRDIGGPEPVTPVPFEFEKDDQLSLQAEWVTLEAEYLGRQDGPLDVVYHFQNGGQFFEALHGNTQAKVRPEMVVGDRVRLTGICELTTTRPLPRYNMVDGFRIHLPETGGIEIVSRAPWWTPRRLYIALGLTSGAAALGFLGTWMLRRQVKRQMAIISEKLQTEAVGGERDRMARELHDTLEQQLSGMALQLAILDDVVKHNPVASPLLSVARRMLRYTRVEARRSVWDLRSKVLEQEGLPAALRAITETAASPEGPDIVVEVTGHERPLAAGVDFHLLRIAQEATTNAIKHGETRSIRIELEYFPEMTSLTVRDDGRGFDPATASPDAGSHFGLLGMEERAEKIGAVLTIKARPGQGCAVTVTVSNHSTSKSA